VTFLSQRVSVSQALSAVSVSNSELDTLIDDATAASLPPGTPGDVKHLKPFPIGSPDGRRRESGAQNVSPFATRISALRSVEAAPSGRSNSDERPKRRASNATLRHRSSHINDSGQACASTCATP
jgi:hypothetical protein